MTPTINSEIIVEHLKERKALPSVERLFGQDGIHVDGEQRPENLTVLDEQVGKPCESLMASLEVVFGS